MSLRNLELEPTDFIATCRALKAAARGRPNRTVYLRFSPSELFIESEWGGGVVRTNGSFDAQLRVTYGVLSSVASLHGKAAKTGAWIKCILDDELKEIQFPLGGFKATFNG